MLAIHLLARQHTTTAAPPERRGNVVSALGRRRGRQRNVHQAGEIRYSAGTW